MWKSLRQAALAIAVLFGASVAAEARNGPTDDLGGQLEEAREALRTAKPGKTAVYKRTIRRLEQKLARQKAKQAREAKKRRSKRAKALESKRRTTIRRLRDRARRAILASREARKALRQLRDMRAGVTATGVVEGRQRDRELDDARRRVKHWMRQLSTHHAQVLRHRIELAQLDFELRALR